jgi:6-phosphofructokinase 1
MKRIGVLTSGGDAPGMNPALRAVVRAAATRGVEVMGIRRGYAGLMEGECIDLPPTAVSGIINRGGTILQSARSEEFKTAEGQRRALRTLESSRLEGLVIVGGNGTARGAWALCHDHGFPVNLLPSSIDNDLGGTDLSLGFDTAVNTALESIDRIRDTAVSHDRIFVVEVMGRDKGFIALEVGLAAGAEAIIVPELKYSPDHLTGIIEDGTRRGKKSFIIVVAEGAAEGSQVARDITQRLGLEVRVTVLGHVQRGGPPTAVDRCLASMFGAAATDMLLDGEAGRMVGVEVGWRAAYPERDWEREFGAEVGKPGRALVSSPIEAVWKLEKTVDLAMHHLAERLAR